MSYLIVSNVSKEARSGSCHDTRYTIWRESVGKIDRVVEYEPPNNEEYDQQHLHHGNKIHSQLSNLNAP